MPPPFPGIVHPNVAHHPGMYLPTAHPMMGHAAMGPMNGFGPYLAMPHHAAYAPAASSVDPHGASSSSIHNPFFGGFGFAMPVHAPSPIDMAYHLHMATFALMTAYGVHTPHDITHAAAAVVPALSMPQHLAPSAPLAAIVPTTAPTAVAKPAPKRGVKRTSADIQPAAAADGGQTAAASSSASAASPAKKMWFKKAKLSDAQRAAEKQKLEVEKKQFAAMFAPNGGSVDTARLYDRMGEMARAHRLGSALKDANGKTEANRFDDAMANEHFAGLVYAKVRVRSKQEEPSDPRGAGLDELFRTSNTLEWFRRSAGMVTGKAPTSTLTIDGHTSEVSWLDLQRHVRVGTDTVAFKDGQGHVGALWLYMTGPKGGQYGTQEPFHDERNDRILITGTPQEALLTAMHAHITLTGNRDDLEKRLSERRLFDVKGHDSSDPDDRAAMIDRFLFIRDQMKVAFLRAGGDERLLSPKPRLHGPPPLNPTSNQAFQNFPQYGYSL